MTAIFECTETTPWDRKTKMRVRHHGAGEVGEQEDGYPGGDIVRMHCRFCGHEWKQELPQ
jgi:hypothetical protein